MTTTLGFIGAGNMAGAIVRGVVRSGLVPAGQIGAFDPNDAALQHLTEETGIVPFAGNLDLVADAATVVLAVKPHLVPGVLEQVGGLLQERKPLVVSIAAGVTLAHLEGWLSPATPIVRVMPNLNVAVGQGMAAVTANQAATSDQVEQVLALFRAVGQAIEVEERLFPAFTAIAGSSPAWTFLYIDALARGALAAGMTKAQAREAATQAVLGSAAMLAASSDHAWELIDRVSSPGGTTVAGLNALEAKGFSSAVIAAVQATIAREAELRTGS
ncbi:MAG: pyrroline-5-carboxylate reductase [Bifidobacteriaceae bacterium]|jgi:pyrroline-5-carboxylate reductase|nr:pyrroline-5-carboxylate reductase [Bifidobacteriaceae bacterium]